MPYSILVRLNEKNIFLLDGAGAFLTAVFTGLVLPHFSQWIGLSKSILYYLAVIGSIYGAYSLGCYRFAVRNRPVMLFVIAWANLFYCLLATIIIVAVNGLTTLGRAYFAVEIIVILGLVVVEARVYQKTRERRLNP